MKINGHELYSYIVSGAKNVIVNEQNLNRLNVFPVPDGDTGTNLALTMTSILQGAEKNEDAGQTMLKIARLSIDNAYGNSGMIFAQYFNGWSQAIESKSSLSPSELIESLRFAAQHTIKSVTHPKEGTILTVMREWANNFDSHVDEDYEAIFETSLKSLQEGVNQTKQQLKVLRDNNVVDAGAQAFYYFIEGIVRFIKNHNLEDLEYKAAILDIIEEDFKSVDVGVYRYCAQYLIKSELTQEEVAKRLEHFGDSIVVNKNESHINIHLHTNEPNVVMGLLVKDNEVLSHKADDMWLQANLIHKKKAKMVIITDSIADLPKQFMDDEHCVLLPLNLIIDSVVYMDKVTIQAKEFYEHLDDYHYNPSSSQANPKSIERAFNQVLQHYDEVIGIFVSSKMSGTFDNIRKSINKLKTEGKRIEIIDSKSNSVTEGLLVYEALKLKKEGKSFDEIIERLNTIIPNLRIYVSVKDLKYMLKGGRVSKVTGFILSKLKLQPVISIDSEGKGIIPFKSLNQKSAIRSILNCIRKDELETGIESYALVYSDNPSDLNEFSKSVKSILNREPEYIESISPIVGLNAGKGAIAIGYIKKS
ncbi:MAG TPA: DegV family protein [Erysipelotrichaceae bacterium]|nr:DegV family protein [Erysipelotrichaceae bacterium]